MPVGAGVTVDLRWTAHDGGGSRQDTGSTKIAKGNYTTLYTLKKRRWYGGYRGVPQKPINPDDDKYVRFLCSGSSAVFLCCTFARWETLEDVPWGAIDSDDEDEEEDEE